MNPRPNGQNSRPFGGKRHIGRLFFLFWVRRPTLNLLAPSYKPSMSHHIIRISVSTLLLPMSLWVILLMLSRCEASEGTQTATATIEEGKQKGAHIWAVEDTSDFDFLSRNHIEWATFICWADQDDYDSPVLTHHLGDSLQLQRHNDRYLRRLKNARDKGFKVFVKPHIWLHTLQKAGGVPIYSPATRRIGKSGNRITGISFCAMPILQKKPRQKCFVWVRRSPGCPLKKPSFGRT